MALAMCSVENAILGIIDLDTIINDFASRNAHRSFFAIIIYKVFEVTILAFFAVLLVCTIDNVLQKLNIYY